MTEQDVDALKRRGRRRLIGAIALMLLAVIVLPMVFDAEPRLSTPPVNVRIPDEDGSAFKPRVLPPGATEVPRGQTASPAPSAPAAKDQPSAVAKEEAAQPAAPQASAPAASRPSAAAAPPTAAETPSSAAPAEAPAAKTATAPAAPAKPAPAPVAKAAPATPAPAPKVAASEPKSGGANGGFIIPIAALSDAEKVKALTGTLSGAKIPYYTEPLATAKGQVTRIRAGPFGSKDQADQALTRLRALGLKPGNAIPRSG